MNFKQNVNWFFPPTTNKKGLSKSKYDVKHVSIIECNLFDEPVIAMSDIHSQTPELVPMLDDLVNLDQFVVLTCGDMAGGYVMGEDGDPTPEYQFLATRSKEFYFVQGNHDEPDSDNKQKKIKNRQDKFCQIPDGSTVKSLVGSIGGVNGIISDKAHPYKMSSYKYHTFLKQALNKKPYILMTHDTPAIPVFYDNGSPYIGNNDIFKIVDTYKPKVHFYGHCHHPTIHNLINGTNYINLDARVLIFVKPDKTDNHDNLFKKPLEETYSPKAQKLYIYE